MNIKEKAKEISKKLQTLAEDSQTEFQTTIQLSEDQAMIFQVIKTFTKAADDSLTDDDIINMVFRNGLVYELQRIKEARQKIYDMGNIELLADENNIGLSEEERQVASVVVAPPKTIDEYWKLGYITIQCPQCQARAVWHKEAKDYQCLDGCRKVGLLEQ